MVFGSSPTTCGVLRRRPGISGTVSGAKRFSLRCNALRTGMARTASDRGRSASFSGKAGKGRGRRARPRAPPPPGGPTTNAFRETPGGLSAPPAACGLLGGVYRRRVLADRSLRAAERVLYPEDMERADRIFLTNSVRGLLSARLAGRAAGSLAG